VLHAEDDGPFADVCRAFLEELESVGVGVAVYTADGRLGYVNEACVSLLGYDSGDLIGTPVFEVNPRLDADRFDEYRDSYETGETRSHRAAHERADGTTVPVRTVTTCRRIHDAVYHFGTVYRDD